MDKIIFNEGGQPLYLDDLQNLQSSAMSLAQGILYAMVHGDQVDRRVMWLDKPSITTTYEAGTGYKRQIEGMFHTNPVIWVYGYGITDVVSAELVTENETDPIYVKITKTSSDYRTLDNEQIVACKETLTAEFTTESGDDTYNINNLPFVMEHLKYILDNLNS